MTDGSNLKTFDLRHVIRFYFYAATFGFFTGVSTLVIIYTRHGLKTFTLSTALAIVSPLGMLWKDETTLVGQMQVICLNKDALPCLVCAFWFGSTPLHWFMHIFTALGAPGLAFTCATLLTAV